MNLARLEMRALFIVLPRKAKRFHIEADERALNAILRGFSKSIVIVEYAGRSAAAGSSPMRPALLC
jgi:hypothetical protein